MEEQQQQQRQVGIQLSSRIDQSLDNRRVKPAIVGAAAAAVTTVVISDVMNIARSAMRSGMSAARSRRNNNATIIIAAINVAMIGTVIAIASMAIHAPPRSWTPATATTVLRLRPRNNKISSSNKSRPGAHRNWRSCRSARS